MNRGFAAGILVALAAAIAALAILIPKFQISKDSQTLGSVARGNEYFATTTKAANGSVLANYSLLNSGPGALGSVIMTGAAAGVINLYDGTTTQNHPDWATTTLATIPASLAAGTYTFDAVYQKGLIVEFLSATVPTSTITFR